MVHLIQYLHLNPYSIQVFLQNIKYYILYIIFESI